MEVGERGAKHSIGSIISSAPNNNLQNPPAASLDRLHRDQSIMATAALMNPSPAPFHSAAQLLHHHPASASTYSSSYHHSQAAPTSASMASPAEPRRLADEDGPQRQSLPQSLPPISEVISGAKPSTYATSGPSSSLPSPFSATAPRPFPESSSDRNPSPRTMNPTSAFQRTEPMPPVVDPGRTGFSSQPPPPINTFPPLTSSYKHEHHEMEQRRSEGSLMNGSYSAQHSAVSPRQYSQTGSLPSGQLPLPPYHRPSSPQFQHGGPPLHSPYEAHRPAYHSEEADFARRGPKYESAFSRHFQDWSYQDSLQQILHTSRSIGNLAQRYEHAAREQQGAPGQARLPSEDELREALVEASVMKKELEGIRDLVVQTREDERAREGSVRKMYDEEEMAMYRDGLKPAFGMTEVKKRRGRAAPPGRCHSCNRIDTPEWRRGPDGARTLCNACGLHYAKLERKRQTEQRTIRPKPSD